MAIIPVFEWPYMRHCIERSVVCWQEIEEALTIVPDLIEATTDKVWVIQEWMRAAQSHQKSYADQRRKPLEFQVGDLVFLKVLPAKGITKFVIRKLSPRNIGSYPILQKVEEVAYLLELPPEPPTVQMRFTCHNCKSKSWAPLK